MSDRLRTGCGLARPVRWPLHAIMAALVLSCSLAAWAGEEEPASTTAQTREDARRAIPLEKIEPEYRERVRAVTSDPSLFRRMPTNVVDCRPEMFTYFSENPEAMVAIWRQLGVSHVELVRMGENTFRLSDGAGTTGDLVLVEQTCDASAQNRTVIYAKGRYEGKGVQRPIGAECVLLLRSGSMEETNGRHFVAARLDAFIKLDRMSLELIAKVVHPLVGQTADRNFADTLSFLSNLSYTAEKRPASIEQLAGELGNVEEMRRRRLVEVAYQCAAAGEEWRLSRGTKPSEKVSR